MILVGSTAIKHHFPSFKREPKDIDYIVAVPMPRQKGVEYLVNPVLCGYEGEVLSPDLLYTLKASHLFLDIQWAKHEVNVITGLHKITPIDYKDFYIDNS